MHNLLRHEPGETDDYASCSQLKALQKLGGGEGRFRKVTGMDGDRGAQSERLKKRNRHSSGPERGRYRQTETPAKTEMRKQIEGDSNRIIQ